MQLSDFDDIRPCSEGEMKEAFESMLNDRQFDKILQGIIPLPKGIRNGLLRMMFTGVKTPLDFQKRFMKPMVYYALHKGATGHSCHFPQSLDKKGNYTFMSNHRDIVLDSAILDVMLIAEKFSTTVEIAIGDNLLIYPWIKTLVRMNKSFTVNRGLTPKEMLKSSIHMSQYMHFAINEKHENIWIAQREGRAKDSNDLTQESVLKMLNMGGPTTGKTTADIITNLRHMNIVPLAISYEYDPCDYLKAKEFQCKRDIPGWKKAKQDDLDNMKIGIWGQKGHVHYQAADCINDWLDTLNAEEIERADIFRIVAEHIDHEIHKNYRIYSGNKAAAAELRGEKIDDPKFEAYLKGKLAKIDLDNPDMPYLRERILTMYANPYFNYEKAVKN
ncbi:MAG: 1-acyl-sn-glycerol-3-phosphate acyltransferase [Bacteroidaceae bacterium]|nr:1-acyl-sn-glycerol-3-phosphate acyltransferase [Bacteroidaceae bacterium]